MEQKNRIELEGWVEGVQKVLAIKTIRMFGHLGLAEAKKVIDACIDGQASSFTVVDEKHAQNAARKMVGLGFKVRVADQKMEPNLQVERPSYLDSSIGIFVPSEINWDEELNELKVVGRLTSGDLNVGSKIGIPIHERLAFTDTISKVESLGANLILYLCTLDEEADFQFDFWDGMQIIGEELPIYPSELE